MRLDHLLSTENLIVCLAWFPGFVPWGVGRAGVEGSLRPCCGGGYGHAVGFPGRHGPPCRGVGVRVPAMGSCPVVAGWGCVVWRGGLRTGEWTRADRVAALFWGGWLWSACTDVFRPGPRFGGLVVV